MPLCTNVHLHEVQLSCYILSRCSQSGISESSRLQVQQLHPCCSVRCSQCNRDSPGDSGRVPGGTTESGRWIRGSLGRLRATPGRLRVAPGESGVVSGQSGFECHVKRSRGGFQLSWPDVRRVRAIQWRVVL
ncbi:hypothetical protein Zmor_017743 [Zophobas morio]|uniref:Uncharacterized protein n=1 Tax=Zophobas morio TaxID=2755281 RepID=A0AA38IA58_9CUCU|nr:hypothetical protein Zmor_017743 [Zophobas morio]